MSGQRRKNRVPLQAGTKGTRGASGATGCMAESDPADTGHYRSRVLSVQQTGDAAVGVVAEENY